MNLTPLFRLIFLFFIINFVTLSGRCQGGFISIETNAPGNSNLNPSVCTAFDLLFEQFTNPKIYSVEFSLPNIANTTNFSSNPDNTLFTSTNGVENCNFTINLTGLNCQQLDDIVSNNLLSVQAFDVNGGLISSYFINQISLPQFTFNQLAFNPVQSLGADFTRSFILTATQAGHFYGNLSTPGTDVKVAATIEQEVLVKSVDYKIYNPSGTLIVANNAAYNCSNCSCSDLESFLPCSPLCTTAYNLDISLPVQFTGGWSIEVIEHCYAKRAVVPSQNFQSNYAINSLPCFNNATCGLFNLNETLNSDIVHETFNVQFNSNASRIDLDPPVNPAAPFEYVLDFDNDIRLYTVELEINNDFFLVNAAAIQVGMMQNNNFTPFSSPSTGCSLVTSTNVNSNQYIRFNFLNSAGCTTPQNLPNNIWPCIASASQYPFDFQANQNLVIRFPAGSIQLNTQSNSPIGDCDYEHLEFVTNVALDARAPGRINLNWSADHSSLNTDPGITPNLNHYYNSNNHPSPLTPITGGGGRITGQTDNSTPYSSFATATASNTDISQTGSVSVPSTVTITSTFNRTSGASPWQLCGPVLGGGSLSTGQNNLIVNTADQGQIYVLEVTLPFGYALSNCILSYQTYTFATQSTNTPQSQTITPTFITIQGAYPCTTYTFQIFDNNLGSNNPYQSLINATITYDVDMINCPFTSFSCGNAPGNITPPPSNAPNTFGSSIISERYLAYLGNTNTIPMVLNCNSVELFAHCDGQCTSAIHTASVDLARSTFGWSNQTDFISGAAQLAAPPASLTNFEQDITLHNVYLADQFTISATGSYQGGATSSGLQFIMEYDTPNLNPILQPVSAQFTLTNISTCVGCTAIINVNAPTCNGCTTGITTPITDASINFGFDLSSVIINNIATDLRSASFDITGSFIYQFDASEAANDLPPGHYLLDNIRMQYWLTEDVNTKGNDFQLSCDGLGDRLNLLVVGLTHHISLDDHNTVDLDYVSNTENNSTANGCEVRSNLKYTATGGWPAGINAFPSEFRPIAVIDEPLQGLVEHAFLTNAHLSKYDDALAALNPPQPSLTHNLTIWNQANINQSNACVNNLNGLYYPAQSQTSWSLNYATNHFQFNQATAQIGPLVTDWGTIRVLENHQRLNLAFDFAHCGNPELTPLNLAGNRFNCIEKYNGLNWVFSSPISYSPLPAIPNTIVTAPLVMSALNAAVGTPPVFNSSQNTFDLVFELENQDLLNTLYFYNTDPEINIVQISALDNGNLIPFCSLQPFNPLHQFFYACDPIPYDAVNKITILATVTLTHPCPWDEIAQQYTPLISKMYYGSYCVGCSLINSTNPVDLVNALTSCSRPLEYDFSLNLQRQNASLSLTSPTSSVNCGSTTVAFNLDVQFYPMPQTFANYTLQLTANNGQSFMPTDHITVQVLGANQVPILNNILPNNNSIIPGPNLYFDLPLGALPFPRPWAPLRIRVLYNGYQNPFVNNLLVKLLYTDGCATPYEWNDGPVIFLQPANNLNLTGNAAITHPTCLSSNGAIDVSNLAIIGASNYTYTISDLAGNTISNTASAAGLPAGNYTATIHTANPNCNYQFYYSLISENCCLPPGFDPDLALIIQNQSVSDMGIGTNATGYPWVIITEKLVVDQNFDFNNCPAILMQAGASIEVLQGNQLTINNSHLTGCDQMWKGIIVHPQANIIVKESSIADANVAIDLQAARGYTISNTTFTNNYIGLQCGPHPAAPSSAVGMMGRITGALFTGSGTMLPHYSGQGPYLGSFPFAGIVAAHQLNCNIGSIAGSANEFKQLNYGIYAQYTNLSIKNSKFIAILNTDNYTNNGTSGSGIYTFSDKTHHLKQQGNNMPSRYDFEKCNNGIFADGVNVKVFNNNLFNCDNGIWIRNVKGDKSNIDIHANILDCNWNGIYLHLNMAERTSISYNLITMGLRQTINGTQAQTRGIWNDQVTNSNLQASISRNNIWLKDRGFIGIDLRGAPDFLIEHNNVMLDNVNTNKNGIALEGSNFTKVRCNSIAGITGNLSNSSQSGIYTLNSSSNSYFCNTVNNTFDGIKFSGNCIQNTNLSSNDIWNHYNGLLVTAGGSINGQSLKGNLWHQQNYSGFGAVNLNTNSAISNSIDFNINFMTTTTLMNRPIVGEINPSAWFTPVNGTEETCAFEQQAHGICSYAELPPLGDDDELNEAILAAQNQTGAVEFDNASRWQGQYNLYDKLSNEPWWLDSSIVLDSFYTAMQYSTIAQIYEMKEGKDGLNNLQSSVAQQILVRQNSIKLLYNETLRLDSIIDSTTDSLKLDSLNLLKNSVVASMKPLVDQNEMAYQVLLSEKIMRADSLEAYNASIIDTNAIEGFNKDINAIELETIGKENPEALLDHEQELFAIANQCPLAGGEAVSRARTFYAYIDPMYYFNDELLCLQAGLLLRKKNGEIHTTAVFPNPASSSVQIVSYSPFKEIEVLNSIGIKVFNYKFSEETTLSKFNIETIPSGIYQIAIKDLSGRIIDINSLAIIK
ncbi:MAG: hypothetical protein RIQ89_1489 [Bacteroidota bacterium]